MGSGAMTLNQDPMERANHQLERATKRARSIMAEARERSAALIERALAGVAQLEEQARQEGLAAGYKEGMERGLSEARSLCEDLQKQQEEVQEHYREVLASTDRELAEASLGLAERIVGDIISLEPERVVEMARAVISQLSDEACIRLRTHSDYASILEMRRQELLAASPGITSVEVVADESLSPGVVVEGKWGYVDSTLHAQLGEIDRMIKGASEGQKKF